MSPSPTAGRAGRPLEDRDPIRHITGDLRSEKLSLHLSQQMVTIAIPFVACSWGSLTTHSHTMQCMHRHAESDDSNYTTSYIQSMHTYSDTQIGLVQSLKNDSSLAGAICEPRCSSIMQSCAFFLFLYSALTVRGEYN